MQRYEKVLSRLPETRKVFMKADGSAYKEGEVFRQPQLAQTLRHVARDGVSYMYRGNWARRFVGAVTRDGGRLTLEDMTAYRVEWTDPMRISYGNFEVTSIGGTHRGARVALGSLMAAEAANLKRYGHYTKSAQTLLYLIQINAIQNQLASPVAERRASAVPGLDPTPQSQISRETAQRIVAHIRNMRTPAVEVTDGSHTSPIVVVDARGDVASMVPSINTASWGETGIFVDGVSIPDSARFQQPIIASVGPGMRLPDPTNPLLVLRDGKPFLTCGAMGGNGVPSLVLQRLVSILEFGTDVGTAAAEPYTLGTYLAGGATAGEVKKEVVLTGTFSPIVIDQLRTLGQAVEVMPESQQEAQWIAIQVDPLTRQLQSGVTRELPALNEAY
jgi:gamma-glutamyltranspeptidase/glutathione hydrolase